MTHYPHYKNFKHLHVPSGWEQYWSKYPNGYSLLEALIDWTGQVNDMIDTVNHNNAHVTTLDRNFRALDKELRASWKGYKKHTKKEYTDFREEILTIVNNWIATIEPTIQDEVVKSLVSWLDDGTLADIINNDVFDMKADKTYVDDNFDKRGLDISNYIDLESENVSDLLNDFMTGLPDNSKVLFPSNNYELENSVYVRGKKNIVIEGNNAVISGKGLYFVDCEHVKVSGLTFDGGVATKTAVSDGLRFEDSDYITINNNHFHNSVVRLRSTVKDEWHENVIVSNNVFKGDFYVARELTSANIIEMYGYRNVFITNNSIDVNRPYRIMKISTTQGYETGEVMQETGISEKIIITGNTINGSCDKQMIDTYAGARKFVFSNNIVDLNFLTTFIESKSSGVISTIYSEYMVTNNVFKGNSLRPLDIKSGFGSDYNMNKSSLIIANNIFEVNKNRLQHFIRARGFNHLNINNNIGKTFLNGEQDQSNIAISIDLVSIEHLKINSNYFDYGSYQLVPRGGSSGEMSYDGEFKTISISDNTINAGSFGSVNIRNFDAVEGLVNITGNTLLNSEDNTSFLAHVFLRDSHIKKVVVSDNVGDSPTSNRIQTVGSTFEEITEHGNTWNPLITYGSSTPTDGTHKRGDIRYNISPAIGGTLGWVCVSSGSPGQWASFGEITTN